MLIQLQIQIIMESKMSESKMKVVNESKNNVSQRKLGSLFNCSKTQLCRILQDKNEIENLWKSNANKNIKRQIFQPNFKINNALIKWFEEARSRNLPINGKILQEKAFAFAEKLKIDSFHASNGWLAKFCKRNNLSFQNLCGESESVNVTAATEWIQRIPEFIMKYELKDIYNVDETSLQYRLLPSKSLSRKGDNPHGMKKSKDRITILLCVSAFEIKRYR